MMKLLHNTLNESVAIFNTRYDFVSRVSSAVVLLFHCDWAQVQTNFKFVLFETNVVTVVTHFFAGIFLAAM